MHHNITWVLHQASQRPEPQHPGEQPAGHTSGRCAVSANLTVTAGESSALLVGQSALTAHAFTMCRDADEDAEPEWPSDAEVG